LGKKKICTCWNFFSFHALLQKKYKMFEEELFGFFSSLVLLLLPFFIFTQNEIFTDVISYSLTRSAGVSKIDILWFFILKDFLFFIILIFNLFNFRKNLFFSMISVFSILFFLFYTDPYYLYLNFLPPFLCLSLPYFIDFLQKQFSLQKMVIPTIILFFLLYTFSLYFASFRDLGKFTDINQLVHVVDQKHPSALYGVNDTTPALAFLTQTPLLNNIVDTNTNIFRKGLLHATVLTNDAVKQKAIIITHGADYPQYGIKELVMDEIFDKQVLSKHCSLMYSQPIYTEGITNRINLFSCR
jgi:hypothetical protein